ncbi:MULTISPECIES: MobH family relaxase [unclassified Methylibium]|uniref:MobH family relaxase n=1 Tax=unclassified Methylibium TaxID=2633235 RepID=UPI0003F3F7AD|nr:MULTISPECIES: MobH family relaxase [unclassified Methylibium]EWS56802.1 integrating conjugative element relaxase, PFGI-1 class [Methylibium sp. T29]EWS61961.1 integrating conjugative element relaxase, PFGI-1 class [Methylibium sp. T29-B]
MHALPTSSRTDSSGHPYAPADPGFVCAAVGSILAEHDNLLARIRLCFGVDRETFARDALALIEAYAGYVHLLPATPDNYFRQPGGLLQLGLEVAFYALQGTDAHIFSGQSTISTRRQLEPRWRHATFIGGLCCELHRALASLIVVDADGNEWPSYLMPLATWLAESRIERYFVRWRTQAPEARSLGLFAVPHVVQPAVLQNLSAGNTVIVPHLLASVGGLPVYREPNVLDSLVRRSLALVIDRNLKASADRYGSPQFGSHLERYLVDALRRLASAESAWVPNRDKSRVWYGSDGLFLLWPQCAADAQALLEADQLPGIPKSADTVLDLLLAAGVAEPRDSSHNTWLIQPPGAKGPLDAIKLTSPAILWSGPEGSPHPHAGTLATNLEPTRPMAATAGPAPPPLPPGQMSLLDAAEADPSANVPSTVPPAVEAAAMTPIVLKAPMRLNPAVRDALGSIVATLNSDARTSAAYTVATGIFVPLAELERRGLQPALAMRALGDLRMLVHADANRPPTTSRDFGGVTTVGLILDPRFVAGLDLATFAIPESPRA